MSRVAKMPIAVPAGAEVAITAAAITVKGPLGTLTQALNGLVKVENNGGTLSFDVVNDSRESNAMSGTLRALVNNMVTGVTKGFEKNPAQLHVAEEHHAGRAPILDRVGEDVAVHEQAVGLACEHRAPLAIKVAEADGGLAGIDADAEEVELELERQRPEILADRQVPLHAEPALLDGDAGLSVIAESSRFRRDLRRTERVVPRRIHSAGVVARVGLGEAVNLERHLGLGPDRRGQCIGNKESCGRTDATQKTGWQHCSSLSNNERWVTTNLLVTGAVTRSKHSGTLATARP